ncbi:MAG: transposase family protein [Egibacteraceae bacterium]
MGWSKEQQFRRLRYVVCPAAGSKTQSGLRGAGPHAATRLSRLSNQLGPPSVGRGDLHRPGPPHRQLLRSGRVHPAGQTVAGYARSAGAYVHHGNPKLAWAWPLRPGALVILSIAAAATLAGARGFVAIGEYSGELDQDVRARLGARRHPVTGQRVAPHESTLRLALQRVDPDKLDAAVGAWSARE